MAKVNKVSRAVPVVKTVTEYEEVTEYQLTLNEEELRRVAICLARTEIGSPKVYDVLPKDVQDWVRNRNVHEKDAYLLREPAPRPPSYHATRSSPSA